MSESLKTLRKLFSAASELSSSEQRAYLRELSKQSPQTAANLSDLLGKQSENSDRFQQLLENSVWPALNTLSESPTLLQTALDKTNLDSVIAQDPLIGSNVSHFQIHELIGRGGMSTVYRGRDIVLDRDVALKFLPPSLGSDKKTQERFIHEAKAASALDHRNIATIHEIGQTENQQLFIAMGYYPGGTLGDLIEKGPLDIDQTIDFAIQLARALEVAHKNGVIHRDIKPSNLILSAEGDLVLLDFGIAKLSHESGYTMQGQILGTCAYMSPEQARGETVDEKADIWSFGVVFYELLTGIRPFQGETIQEVLRNIQEVKPPLPNRNDKKVPPTLSSILSRCLAKDPQKRYPDASVLREDLIAAKSKSMPTSPSLSSTWKQSRKRKLATSGAIGIAVAVSAYHLLAPPIDPTLNFTKITHGAIVEDRGSFVGANWVDYDNDGYIDLYVSNQKDDSPNNFYRNNGDGTFSRIHDTPIASDGISTMESLWADYDNDGDQDIFLATEDYSAVRKLHNRFYRNENGIFVRETEGEWVNTPSPSNSGAWGDYDKDGLLDLYLPNDGDPLIEYSYNELWHNEGDGTMSRVDSITTQLKGRSHGALWSDYDMDGDLDLFVSGQDMLQFRNEGSGGFTWVSPENGGIAAYQEDVDVTFGAADYDNDGDLDILYTTWQKESSPQLYRNRAKTRFYNASHSLETPGVVRCICPAWGDFDNDGLIDLYITNRGGKNLLYHNQGNGEFRLIVDSPLTELGKSSADCKWIDYDNDGDLDLFVTNGFYKELGETNELFRNDNHRNSWIVLTLVGTRSNRDAIGAKVWASARINGNEVTQLREIHCSGNGSNGDLRVHFGLGNARKIDLIRIQWPLGHLQELKKVPAKQFLTITEPEN
ncbi:protein kinase domain-containing protein [Pelagicoccus mobilis]|uniref:non-specific serine/threonine protein kinase n=1 Tax=Pelagicoccus mobilis TaxID=415221 RepID=A0A934S0T9_9BACT|nr:FG-GAP-like repeat-containing protein [Pelagicoccus mobilis]MBK1877374.1 VCBS repeat-containing protein [Pelagicoccus mobilis]